ncbi:MAG: VWA domain-containing protein [Candidatus Marinimicrobia bacterium]|nr:VWA domain-containing protein [Candidatus Neomarinimicrobiota bacterium]
MIKFAHLEYIWIFALVGLIAVLIFYSRKKIKKSLNKFARSELVGKLLENYRPRISKISQNLFVVASLLLGIALIGPKIGQSIQEVERKGVDVIIAMDVSKSMDAEDVSPSRLERAKYRVSKFLDQLQGDRIGLVAFAGISYLHCPLTLDYSAANLFLDILDTGVITTQGTAIADAIETALGAFKKESEKNRAIVVISDGEDHEGDIDEAIQKAKDKGVVIYSIGVGTQSGAPIPLINNEGQKTGEYKKDKKGNIVTTRLVSRTLKKIARETDGEYAQLSNNNDAFDKIYKKILGLDKKEYKTHKYTDYENRYQAFLLPGLIFLVISLGVPLLDYKSGGK